MIAGLPATGKTTLANKLAKQKANSFVVDDPDYPDDLVNLPKGIKTVIVTHPNFCQAESRMKAENAIRKIYFDAIVSWIFIENNKELALKNAQNRKPYKKVEGFIHYISKLYNIPANSNILPAYDGSKGYEHKNEVESFYRHEDNGQKIKR